MDGVMADGWCCDSIGCEREGDDASHGDRNEGRSRGPATSDNGKMMVRAQRSMAWMDEEMGEDEGGWMMDGMKEERRGRSGFRKGE